MPTVPLPAAPSLEQLKKQAKDLQRAVRSADTDALVLVAEHHPGGSPTSVAASRFPLDAAQLVVARRYGFASWPRLKHHVQTITRSSQSFRESVVMYTRRTGITPAGTGRPNTTSNAAGEPAPVPTLTPHAGSR